GGHGGINIKKILERASLDIDSDEILRNKSESVIKTIRENVTIFEGMADVVSFMHKAVKGRQAVITSSGHARVIPGLEKNLLLPHFQDLNGMQHIYGIPDTERLDSISARTTQD